MSTQDLVVGILAARAGVPEGEITLESTAESLGLDSMSMVEILFALEEALELPLPYNANEPGSGLDLSSVGAIIAGIDRILSTRAA